MARASQNTTRKPMSESEPTLNSKPILGSESNGIRKPTDLNESDQY